MPSAPGISGSVSAALAPIVSAVSTPTSDREGTSCDPGFCAPSNAGAGQAGGSGHIRVAVRVRPLPAGEDGIIEVAGRGAIAIRKGPATGGNEFLKSQQGKVEERMFDRVFGPEASQSEVYSWTCAPLVAEAVERGRSATVFVYGATGAGKTHTMFGNGSGREQRGLIFRAIPDVFRAIDLLSSGGESGNAPIPDGSFEVKVSFLEIYNEVVRDLLRPDNGSMPTCRVLEDARRGLVEVSNLIEAPVQNSEEAMWYLQAGMQTRTVEATAANSQSSRSHAVFTLTIEQVRRKTPGRGLFQKRQPEVRTQFAKISLIDLAGSERAAFTQNSGSALKDGARINQSLLALANCIDALTTRASRDAAAAQRKKPPYRDSKLTLMLKSSLTGDGLVAMIANVHPGRTHFEDSNNTLEYAKRASVVKAQPARRLARRSAPGHFAHMVLEEESQPSVASSSSPPPPSSTEPPGRRRRKSEDGNSSNAWPVRKGDLADATTASSPDECLSELSLSSRGCGDPEYSEATSSPMLGDDSAALGKETWMAAEDFEEDDEADAEAAEASDAGIEADVRLTHDSQDGLLCSPRDAAPESLPSAGRDLDQSFMSRIIVDLQEEKAQLHKRLCDVTQERDALLRERRQWEQEAEQLWASNLQKDAQIATLLAKGGSDA